MLRQINANEQKEERISKTKVELISQLISQILAISQDNYNINFFATNVLALLKKYCFLSDDKGAFWFTDQQGTLTILAERGLTDPLRTGLKQDLLHELHEWQLLKINSSWDKEHTLTRKDIFLEKTGGCSYGMSFWVAPNQEAHFQFTQPPFIDLFRVINLILLKINQLQVIQQDSLDHLRQTRQLKIDEERHKNLMNAAHDGILIYNLNGVILEANTAACLTMGYSRAELLKNHIWDIEEDASLATLHDKWELLQRGPTHYETKYKRKDVSQFPVDVRLSLFNTTGEKLILAIIRDLSKQKRSENTIRNLTRAIEQSSILVMITDKHGVIEYANTKMLERTGYQANELIGKNVRLLQSGPTLIETYLFIWTELSHGREWRGELLNKNKMGDDIWVSAIISPLRNESNEVTHYLAVMEDISQKRNYEALLIHQATYDTLTNLGNRFYGYSQLERAIVYANKHNKKLAILFIGLDEFKEINESLGYPAGDDLLKAIATRYLSLMGPRDTVVRLGGDEFMVVLEDLNTDDYVEEMAKKCQAAGLEGFTLESEEIFLPSSIGIAVFPEHGTDAKTLMRNADAAMYQSKMRGKNNWTMFINAMAEMMTNRIRIKSELHQVLNRDELYVCYQPIITINDQQTFAAEALLRWQSATLGHVMPDQIIPIAEETGLIIPLGYWILQKVCTHIKEWQTTLGKTIKIAVNVSAIQLRQKNFVTEVHSILKNAGVSPDSLIFEITESVFIDDTKFILQQLNHLNSLGIDCSLDDFGMGYSSLNYVHSYPFKSLKIDRAFIKGIGTSQEDLSLVNSIITMSRNLKLAVIAEGVETNEQLELLHDMQCDMAQGWYFSKALNTNDLLTFWQTRIKGSQ